MTYREDFTKCNGYRCKIKNKCARYAACREYRGIVSSWYLQPSDCIKAEYSEFVAILKDGK